MHAMRHIIKTRRSLQQAALRLAPVAGHSMGFIGFGRTQTRLPWLPPCVMLSWQSVVLAFFTSTSLCNIKCRSPASERFSPSQPTGALLMAWGTPSEPPSQFKFLDPFLCSLSVCMSVRLSVPCITKWKVLWESEVWGFCRQHLATLATPTIRNIKCKQSRFTEFLTVTSTSSRS